MDWMRCIIERFPLFLRPQKKKSSHGKFDSPHNKNASGIFHCSIPDHFFILLSNFTDATLGFSFWMNLLLRFPPQCLEYGFTHHLMLVCIENGNETLPCRIVISLPKYWQCLNEFVPTKLLRREIAERKGVAAISQKNAVNKKTQSVGFKKLLRFLAPPSLLFSCIKLNSL